MLSTNLWEKKESVMIQKISLILSFLLIPFIFSYAQNVPLKDFKAKNADEEAIANVLHDLSEGFKNKDKKQIFSLCRENVEFTDVSGNIYTKEQMMSKKATEWGPKSKAWYGYYNIDMAVEGDKVDVNCMEMRSYGLYKVKMLLIKENQKWQILKYDWKD